MLCGLKDSALSRRKMYKFVASFSVYLEAPQIKVWFTVPEFVIPMLAKEFHLRSVKEMIGAKFN